MIRLNEVLASTFYARGVLCIVSMRTATNTKTGRTSWKLATAAECKREDSHQL